MTQGLGAVCHSAASSLVLAIRDDDRSGLYRITDNWFPRRRQPGAARSLHFELWRSTCFSPDLAGMSGHDWDTIDSMDAYEPWAYGDGGKNGSYFISGQTQDSGGTPRGNAVVMVFRQSDNLFTGFGVSDANGNYQVGTPYSGVAHYAVAYLDIATDLAGTTVNNLTPTAS
jgi:hypothetical protein